MTPLKLLILSTIHKHGPQTEMSLWGNTQFQSLTAVNIAVVTLEEDGFIENTPVHKHPLRFPSDHSVYWQLTEKGRQLIAQRNGAVRMQQEVCLGSK